MATAVEISGIDSIQMGLLKMKETASAGAELFVRRGGGMIASDAKRNSFIPQSEAAAVDTWRSDAWPIPTQRSGNLARSIRTTVVRRVSEGTWMSQTGPTIVYGRRVELGYTGTGRWPYFTTRAFPYLSPALERTRPKLDILYRDIMLQAQNLVWV